MTQLSKAEAQAIELRTNWLETARDKQLQPKFIEHYIWLILAGRGWGKTRTGAQDIALYAVRNNNVAHFWTHPHNFITAPKSKIIFERLCRSIEEKVEANELAIKRQTDFI